jgi:hypothetical protein
VTLSVDPAGLKQGAGRSVSIASALAEGGSGDSTAGDQPSHAGVALMIKAVLDVRTRQSERVQFNAADMVTGADAYDVTDSQAEGRIADSM